MNSTDTNSEEKEMKETAKPIEIAKKFKNCCQLNEFVQKGRANYLYHNIDTYPCRESNDANYNAKEICKKYLKEILKSKNGTIKRCYYNNDGLGRMYLKKGQDGFQTIMREYRAFLCHKDYYDLDIKNAQPTILYYICKMKNIEHHYLELYVLAREKYYGKFRENNKELDKDTFKMFFIAIINGSKNSGTNVFKNLDDECLNFIKKFSNEMENIRNVLLNEKDNKIFIAEAEAKKDFNIDGTAMAYYLQNQENIIVQLAKKFVTAKGYEVSALVFDGLMIKNTIPLSNIILKELNNYIFKSTNIKAEFIIKQFDVKYEPQPAELFYRDEVIVANDEEAAKIIMNELNEEIIKCNNRYFYRKHKNTNIYEEDTTANQKIINEILFSIISKYDIKMETEKGFKEYSKKTQGCNNICEMLFKTLPNTEKFDTKLFDSNIGKLCFLDGYFDSLDMTFKPYDNNVYTIKYIDRKYHKDVKQEDIDLLNEKILDPIMGKDKTKMLRWFSRSLFGKMDKKWAVGLGNRDTGKSVATKLFELSFNGYVKVFNAESMFITRTGDADVAKKLSWIVPFEYSRLYLSNEMKTEDDMGKKFTLDGNCIKSISSGGDTKEARVLYGNARNFQLQGNMCLFMNELVKLSANDAKKNLHQFNFQSIFVLGRELTDDEKKISEQGTGCKYYKADEKVKDIYIKDFNIQNAFIKMIIDNFGEHINKNNDDVDDFDHDEIEDFKTKICELYDFTLNKKDKIKIKEFNDKLKENGITVSPSQIKLFVNTKGVGECVWPGLGRSYTCIKLKEINEN